jgi:general secretion pathway protein D
LHNDELLGSLIRINDSAINDFVNSGGEVAVKMVLEISSVTGTQNIGGISQPIIGQRRIEHEARLKDGEANLIGGILEDSEKASLSGYPWLTKIPILKYLIGQDTKDRTENEILFSITPHIIRSSLTYQVTIELGQSWWHRVL